MVLVLVGCVFLGGFGRRRLGGIVFGGAFWGLAFLFNLAMFFQTYFQISKNQEEKKNIFLNFVTNFSQVVWVIFLIYHIIIIFSIQKCTQ